MGLSIPPQCPVLPPGQPTPAHTRAAGWSTERAGLMLPRAFSFALPSPPCPSVSGGKRTEKIPNSHSKQMKSPRFSVPTDSTVPRSAPPGDIRSCHRIPPSPRSPAPRPGRYLLPQRLEGGADGVDAGPLPGVGQQPPRLLQGFDLRRDAGSLARPRARGGGGRRRRRLRAGGGGGRRRRRRGGEGAGGGGGSERGGSARFPSGRRSRGRRRRSGGCAEPRPPPAQHFELHAETFAAVFASQPPQPPELGGGTEARPGLAFGQRRAPHGAGQCAVALSARPAAPLPVLPPPPPPPRSSRRRRPSAPARPRRAAEPRLAPCVRPCVRQSVRGSLQPASPRRQPARRADERL